jgi:hypothetical protein
MGKGHQVVGGSAVSPAERTSPNGGLWVAAEAGEAVQGAALPGSGEAGAAGGLEAQGAVAEPARVACC